MLDGGSEVAAAIGVTSARGAVPACPSARDGATNGLRSRPSKDCNETIPAFVDTQYHCLNARDPTSRPTCAATTYRTTTTPPPLSRIPGLALIPPPAAVYTYNKLWSCSCSPRLLGLFRP